MGPAFREVIKTVVLAEPSPLITANYPWGPPSLLHASLPGTRFRDAEKKRLSRGHRDRGWLIAKNYNEQSKSAVELLFPERGS